MTAEPTEVPTADTSANANVPANAEPAAAQCPPAVAADGAWVIYCDGSASPNPGRMGLGATLLAPDGTRHTLSLDTGARGCNNEAELRALMAALAFLKVQGATVLRLHSDNSLVVAQLQDAGADPVVRLAPLFDEARALLRGFAQATLVWVPRHRNRDADALARAAVGLPPKAPASPRKK